ncbi:hypothetical protein MUP01_12095 [Candidatus Bathyarchaeota archaeon]|nr:hypothetical protein [Candidatus Bathyarchaeota archaeon]
MTSIKKEGPAVLRIAPWLFFAFMGAAMCILSFFQSGYMAHILWNYFRLDQFHPIPVDHIYGLTSFVFLLLTLIVFRTARAEMERAGA